MTPYWNQGKLTFVRHSSLSSAFPFPPLGAADREQCAGAPEQQRAWLGHQHVLHIQQRSVVRIFARAEPARGEAGVLALADEHPAEIGFRVIQPALHVGHELRLGTKSVLT